MFDEKSIKQTKNCNLMASNVGLLLRRPRAFSNLGTLCDHTEEHNGGACPSRYKITGTKIREITYCR